MQHLEGMEQDGRPRTLSDNTSPAGRPVPDLTKVKAEPGLCDTIPWATPASNPGSVKGKSATASQPSELPRQGAELAQVFDHPHCHAPPPTPSYLQGVGFLAPPVPVSVPHQHQVTVWCHQEHPGDGLPTLQRINTRGFRHRSVDDTAQVFSNITARPSNEGSEEEFEAGLRRMVTRAELHRLGEKKNLPKQE